MVTLSATPGIPLGVQLPATFHAVETEPFQVYETCAFTPNAQLKKMARHKKSFPENDISRLILKFCFTSHS
jgi:hypothetical protein